MFGNLHKCVIEDNNDPLKLGRVRLRVMGVHSAKLSDIATKDLPWSEVLNPVNSGGTLGPSVVSIVGAWGYCVSLNDTFTEFLLVGTVSGQFQQRPSVYDGDGDEMGFRDPAGAFPGDRLNYPTNPLAYGEKLKPDITQKRVKVDQFEEQKDTANKTVYPNNNVYEDAAGNIIEVDATDKNPRIRVQHSTGARFEISADGDVTIQASPDGNIWQETPGLFSIGADGNLIIGCDVKIVGSIEATGEVSDLEGNLSSLRSTYEMHTHVDPQGGTTATPLPLDPRVKFVWVGNPK